MVLIDVKYYPHMCLLAKIEQMNNNSRYEKLK